MRIYKSSLDCIHIIYLHLNKKKHFHVTRIHNICETVRIKLVSIKEGVPRHIDWESWVPTVYYLHWENHFSADYYALLSPHIGSDSSYNGYDPSYHHTSLYNQIRYQSLDRPVKRRRKVPESILKNGYNSLPRGSSSQPGHGPGQENLRFESSQTQKNHQINVNIFWQILLLVSKLIFVCLSVRGERRTSLFTQL